MLLVILTDSPEHPIRYFCFMLLPQVLICPVGLLSPFSSESRTVLFHKIYQPLLIINFAAPTSFDIA